MTIYITQQGSKCVIAVPELIDAQRKLQENCSFLKYRCGSAKRLGLFNEQNTYLPRNASAEINELGGDTKV
jgi:hypothetical protein